MTQVCYQPASPGATQCLDGEERLLRPGQDALGTHANPKNIFFDIFVCDDKGLHQIGFPYKPETQAFYRFIANGKLQVTVNGKAYGIETLIHPLNAEDFIPGWLTRSISLDALKKAVPVPNKLDKESVDDSCINILTRGFALTATDAIFYLEKIRSALLNNWKVPTNPLEGFYLKMIEACREPSLFIKVAVHPVGYKPRGGKLL